MKLSRVAALAAACALGSASLTACSSGSSAAGSSDTIKIGLLTDLTGNFNLFGQPTVNVAKMAVKEINDDGGINGKKVELVVGDDGSEPSTGVTATRKLIGQDRVAVLFGMHNSATREAVEPLAKAASLPYFYTPLFEGGTCEANMVTNGEVPGQQLKRSIPWAQEQTGKNQWYVIGPDYIWGQNVVKQAEGFIKDAGGSVVGSDLVPLGTTDFQGLISKIRSSGAPMLLTAMNGGDAVAFEKQAYAAGLGNARVQRLALMYENATRGAIGSEASAGMYNSMAYDQSVETPENKTFLDEYRKDFGADAPPVTALSSQTWIAIKAWAEAAEKARDTSAAKLLPEVPGVKVAGPGGQVAFLDNHYATQPIFVTQAQPDGTTKVVQNFDAVEPDQDCSTPLGG